MLPPGLFQRIPPLPEGCDEDPPNVPGCWPCAPEFDPFDDAQRARFDVWTDSAYALFAEGEICATLDG